MLRIQKGNPARNLYLYPVLNIFIKGNYVTSIFFCKRMSALRRSVKNAAKSYAPCERDVREATSNDKKASPPLVRNWHQCAFARCSYDISFFFGPSFSWRGAGFQRRRAVADINRCLVYINWWCCCSSSPRSSSLCISSVDFFWVLTSIFVEKKKIDVQQITHQHYLTVATQPC